ncbi:hypothetical protein ALC62_06924 [Cyphomyrmex costatus]|uniref:MADF domain-containing protein n=1 Tax=Cyphomyrmex costatus TaxID=456900 RepID=A0A151K2A8_9HYME|nr:hypothetical protein ALC62_06924 [Cyphomyrmex costatus]
MEFNNDENSSSMEYNCEDINELIIHYVRIRPQLWDFKNKQYKDNIIKKNCDEFVKNRWRNLRDRYIKEKKKSITKSGQAAVQFSPWSLMASLSFLSDVVEFRKRNVLQTQKGRTFKTRSKIAVDNLDIFLYVNSKFVYVEKHIKKQLTQLYRNLMEQKCAIEKQVLQNALTLASIAPDETAYRIMREPGYIAVLPGEALHLVKCIPVECKLRHEEHCYTELPVTHANKSFFLQPRSRILTKTGTLRYCNQLLPIMYKLHGVWFRLTPKPIEVIAPAIMQPLSHPIWQYSSSSSLATNGIYSAKNLDRLRAHITFPVERPSILVNTLARGAMGNEIPAGSISLANLLDEDSLNRIADSAGKRVWKGFVTFGSASADVLAISIIIRVVKLIIDTMIHGYALHTMYGWSLHLIGAIWSSVTHLLLHLGRRQDANPQDAQESAPPEDRPSTSLPPTEDQQPCQSQPHVTVHEINEKGQIAPDKYKQYSYVELRKYLDNNKPGE